MFPTEFSDDRQPSIELQNLDLAAQQQVPNMTYGDLAVALGIKFNDVNEPTNDEMVAFVNACIHVQTNPEVTSLPRSKQIEILSASMAALDNLF